MIGTALLPILVVGLAWGQEFEVAAVKGSAPGAKGGGEFSPAGRLTMTASTMLQLITFAWGLDPEMVLSAPGWVTSDRFDVSAKAPAGTTMPTMRIMMRSLLAERFKLSVHNEERMMAVYALKLGNHAAKLRNTTGSAEPECRMKAVEGIRTFVCQNMTMDGLADRLRDVAPAYLDHPVVNSTGLEGSYDFTLAWAARDQLRAIDGLTIFEAIGRQLGLDLAASKHPLQAIVIDRLERTPTEN